MPRAKKKALVEPSTMSVGGPVAPAKEKRDTLSEGTVLARPIRRVLIFSLTYFPRFVAGAEIALKEILDRFPEVQNNNQSGADNKIAPQYQFEMITLRIDSRSPKEEVIGNVRIHRIGYAGKLASDERTVPLLYAQNKYLFTVLACIKALQLHIKNPYHIIWSIMANYAGFAALFFKKITSLAVYITRKGNVILPKTLVRTLCRISGVRFILTLQEGDPLMHMRRRVGPLWFLYKAIYRNADHIQAISNYLSLMSREVGYGGDVTVIPNGVNGAHFSQKVSHERISEIRELWGTTFINIRSNTHNAITERLQSDAVSSPQSGRPIYIISTSRLVLKNAVDDIIRALTLLSEDVHLLVYGVGPDRAALEELSLNLGVAHRISWQGFVGHDELPLLLQAADIFVRPSLSEGFGNSFIEAMAAGVPVVGTNVGGIADFLSDDNGYIVEPRNPESIANAIRAILTHPRIAAKKASAARTMALRDYDWKTITSAMFNLFEKVLQQNIIDMGNCSACAPALPADSLGEASIRSKHFLIATGIYPPDIGGPAQYAKQLNEELTHQGHKVTVCSFSTEKKLPIGIRHIWYFVRVLYRAYRADTIIALDTFSIAIPALCAAKILRRAFIMRIGGDFLWEKYIDRTGEDLVLREFYNLLQAGTIKLSHKERIVYAGTRFVFAHTDAILWSTAWQRDIFSGPYRINLTKSFIVENAYGPRISERIEPRKKNYFAATRMRTVKNIERLKRAFAAAKEKVASISCDIEQVPDARFVELLRGSYAVILVSLSDISPNMIMTAIRCGVPFIVTRETGIYERIKDCAIFVDPKNEDEIKKAIIWLADDVNYKEQCSKVKDFNFVRTYDDIAAEIVKITTSIS